MTAASERRLLLDYVQAPRSGAGEIVFHQNFCDVTERISFFQCAKVVARAGRGLLRDGVRCGDRVVFVFDSTYQSVVVFLALLWTGAVPLTVRGRGFSPEVEYRLYVEGIARRFGARFVFGNVQSALVPGLSLRIDPDEPAPACGAGPDSLAFVQFSSGSTAAPKGVEIRHGALARNLELIANSEVRGQDARGSIWLPLFHDMGLIGLLSAFVTGSTVFVASPADFLMYPFEWLAHLSRDRITSTPIPSFAIQYSLRALSRAEPAELACLELGQLRTIFLGSEVIDVAAASEWVERLKPCGLGEDALRPCYGMAEAVLMVTCCSPGSGLRALALDHGQRVACLGRPLPDFELRICDEQGWELESGAVGEVWLRGGTLADKYLDSEYALLTEDGWYRTGDMGWLEGGELFILGRNGDRFKINGQSYFAADLEHQALRVAVLEPGRVAFVQPEAEIVCVIEANQRLLASKTWLDELLGVLSVSGVPLKRERVIVVGRGQLEKTSSGKLRRRAIAAALVAGKLSPIEICAEGPAVEAQPLSALGRC